MLSHHYHGALSRQDRDSLAPHRRGRGVDAADALNAIVTAVLGLLIYGGRAAIYRRFSVSNFWPEMNRRRRDRHVDPRHDGVPAGPRRGPAGDAALGAPEANTSLRLLAPPLPGRGRLDPEGALRDRHVHRGDRGEPHLPAPPGVENKPNAAGVINDEYFDVRIFDDDDFELPRGTDGEIVIRPSGRTRCSRGVRGRVRGDRRDERQLVVPHR